MKTRKETQAFEAFTVLRNIERYIRSLHRRHCVRYKLPDPPPANEGEIPDDWCHSCRRAFVATMTWASLRLMALHDAHEEGRKAVETYRLFGERTECETH